MAVRLPDFTALGVENVAPGDTRPQYMGSSPEAAAQTQLAGGLESLGTGLQHFEHGVGLLHQQTNLVNAALAQANLHTEIGKRELAIAYETDPAKLDAIKSEIPSLLDQASQTIQDPNYRQLWMARHSTEVSDAQLKADQRQRVIYNDRFLSSAHQQAEDLLLKAQQTSDPAVRNQASNDLATIITSLANAGVMSDTQAHEYGRRAQQTLITGNAHWLDANGDPRAALDSIRANQGALPGDVYDSLVRGFQPRLDKQVGISAGQAAIGGTSFAGSPSHNVANNNPGNIKAGPGTWRVFDTPEAGVEAIGSWLQRAQNTYGLTTIRQLIDDPTRGYAPTADPGNAGKNLPGKAAQLVGVSPDTPVNMNDPEMRSKMIDAIMVQEQGKTAKAYLAGAPRKAGAAPGDVMAQPGPPPMRSREDLLASIPANDPHTGEPLTPEQTQIAEGYVNRQYNLQQQQTEETRARLTQALTGGIQMLADGRDFSYDEPTIRSLLPPEKADLVIQKLDDAKAEGAARNEISGMTPQEIAAQSVQLRSTLDTEGPVGYQKRRAEINGFNRAVEKHFGALGLGPSDKPADPAAYVAVTNPRIAQLYAARGESPQAFSDYATATLTEQARLGVPPEKARVLGAKEAPAMVAGIMSSPEQAPAAMQQLANQSGTAWPQVWRDLTTIGKMPPAFQSVGTLENQADAGDLAKALGVGLKDEKTWDQILSTNARKDIRDAIDGSDAVNNLLRSLDKSGASPTQVAGVKDAIEKLAYAKTFYRQDPSAAANAIKAFTDNYEFLGPARIPTTVFNAVTANAGNMLRAITPDGDINIPQVLTQTPVIPGAATADDYIRELKANPTWITSPMGDALWLMDPYGRIVRHQDNTPFAVPFNAEAPPPPLAPEGAAPAYNELAPENQPPIVPRSKAPQVAPTPTPPPTPPLPPGSSTTAARPGRAGTVVPIPSAGPTTGGP